MNMAEYWKIKHNLPNRIFVEKGCNKDHAQAWETSDLISACHCAWGHYVPSFYSTVPSLMWQSIVPPSGD